MHEVYVAEFFSGNSPDLREAREKKSKCPNLPFKVNELMKYIEPHDREIIWVVGKDGNEGKTWSQKFVKGQLRAFNFFFLWLP